MMKSLILLSGGLPRSSGGLLLCLIVTLLLSAFSVQGHSNHHHHSIDKSADLILSTVVKPDIQYLASMASHNEAVVQLRDWLAKSKHSGESNWSDYALKYFVSLPDYLQNSMAIRFEYAQHLAWQHQFDNALAEFHVIANDRALAANALLQIVNIHMLLGAPDKALPFCNQLKREETPIVATICSLWIKGTLGNHLKSAQSLTVLREQFEKNDPLYFWTSDVLLDLYLHMQEPESALRILNSMRLQDHNDKAPLLQLVDFHLVNRQFNVATALLKAYDVEEQFWLRFAIATRQSPQDLSNQQSHLIHHLQHQSDPAHHFLLALWLLFNVGDEQEASRVAQANWRHFRKRNDLLLLELINDMAVESKEL